MLQTRAPPPGRASCSASTVSSGFCPLSLRGCSESHGCPWDPVPVCRGVSSASNGRPPASPLKYVSIHVLVFQTVPLERTQCPPAAPGASADQRRTAEGHCWPSPRNIFCS